MSRYVMIRNGGSEGYGPPIASFYSKNEAFAHAAFLEEHGFTTGYEIWLVEEWPLKPYRVIEETKIDSST